VTVGILGLASVGAAVYALAEKGSGAGDNNAALQSAVATTVHSKTADIAMSVTISLGAGPGLKIEGNGATDLVKHATNLTMSLNVEGQTLAERVVIAGSTGYVNLGPEVGTVVPGKSWVSEDEGSPTTGASSVGSGGIFSDPSTLIAVLDTEGTSVRALGPSTVVGTPVTGYSIHLGPAGIAKTIRSETIPKSARSAVASAHFHSLDYRVFVDGTNHLRQVRAEGSFAAEGIQAKASSTVDFSDFGTSVTITPPSPNQVVPIEQFEKIVQQDEGTATI